MQRMWESALAPGHRENRMDGVYGGRSAWRMEVPQTLLFYLPRVLRNPRKEPLMNLKLVTLILLMGLFVGCSSDQERRACYDTCTGAGLQYSSVDSFSYAVPTICRCRIVLPIEELINE